MWNGISGFAGGWFGTAPFVWFELFDDLWRVVSVSVESSSNIRIDWWGFAIWSMQVRWKKVYCRVWNWIVIDASVNFDVCHRLLGRRVSVVSSFGSGVRVRMMTSCSPSAMIRTSRWAVDVQIAGRRRTELLVINKVTNDDRTVI